MNIYVFKWAFTDKNSKKTTKNKSKNLSIYVKLNLERIIYIIIEKDLHQKHKRKWGMNKEVQIMKEQVIEQMNKEKMIDNISSLFSNIYFLQ